MVLRLRTVLRRAPELGFPTISVQVGPLGMAQNMNEGVSLNSDGQIVSSSAVVYG